MSKQKLAVIGANHLQKTVVAKANEMGIETHVFAWEKGNVAAEIADYYYPISVTKKTCILNKCIKIGIDAIVSVASDIAMPTVNYIAKEMNLIGNTLESTYRSTNKYAMREQLKEADLKIPNYWIVDEIESIAKFERYLPLIIKPVDREGSIGVRKVERINELQDGVTNAVEKSFEKKCIVEEFIEGKEYSVEMISYEGDHFFLAITEKVTTGSPNFIEIAHHQPAQIPAQIKDKIIKNVKKGIDALGLKYGATHSEVIISKNNEVFIVEIAGRMGGCFIGSHMVYHSTGYDYLQGVIEVALNKFDKSKLETKKNKFSGVYYVLPKEGRITCINDYSNKIGNIVKSEILKKVGDTIIEPIRRSEDRAALFVYAGDKKLSFVPEEVVSFKTEKL